ncbi:hypothetical protein VTN02DRAFT_6685 [Thermoascus thermophilus]
MSWRLTTTRVGTWSLAARIRRSVCGISRREARSWTICIRPRLRLTNPPMNRRIRTPSRPSPSIRSTRLRRPSSPRRMTVRSSCRRWSLRPSRRCIRSTSTRRRIPIPSRHTRPRRCSSPSARRRNPCGSWTSVPVWPRMRCRGMAPRSCRSRGPRTILTSWLRRRLTIG